jgi:hypothetical protein
MVLAKMELMNLKMTRKAKARRKPMVLNPLVEMLLQMTNQRMERTVDKCLKCRPLRANKVAPKIMMMERKNRKEINSQRNLKIDVIE